MTSRITTMLDIRDGDYRLHVGDGYLTFSIDPHGHKVVMVKTADFERVTQLFVKAHGEWLRAKAVEEGANA